MKTTALDSSPQFRPLSTENHLQRADREKESFGENLLQAIDSVDRLQKEADSGIQALATGEKRDLHQTMISMEKAGISFQLMMQVRNKIVAAYQEIMRMQI
jgi:flagellar hook-basal body complex protein FliE